MEKHVQGGAWSLLSFWLTLWNKHVFEVSTLLLDRVRCSDFTRGLSGGWGKPLYSFEIYIYINIQQTVDFV